MVLEGGVQLLHYEREDFDLEWTVPEVLTLRDEALFDAYGQHLEKSKVALSVENNALYNNGLLFSTQKGIRTAALLESFEGRGKPDNPIVKLVRSENSKQQPVLWVAVLNGHHRIGSATLMRVPWYAEVIAMDDRILHRTYINGQYDFEDPSVISMLGLMANPLELTGYWGFNAITQEIRMRLFAQDVI